MNATLYTNYIYIYTKREGKRETQPVIQKHMWGFWAEHLLNIAFNTEAFRTFISVYLGIIIVHKYRF